jgi:hypothetical protein
MAGSYGSQSNPGALLPTTYPFDVAEIYSTNVNSEEFKELLVRLYEFVSDIAVSANKKDAGYYSIEEFLNGQLYFPNPFTTQVSPSGIQYRQVFRTVVNFGALPNATTISIPHNVNVTPGYTLTRLYGGATNAGSTSFIPIPYSSGTLNKNIELNADTLNVNITTSIDYSAYINTYIVFEYIKN